MNKKKQAVCSGKRPVFLFFCPDRGRWGEIADGLRLIKLTEYLIMKIGKFAPVQHEAKQIKKDFFIYRMIEHE